MRTSQHEPQQVPDPLSDASGERVYEQERLILNATEAVYELMELEGVNKTELARRIGHSKGHVTQLLSGSRNLTLRTLADLSSALGHRFEVRAHPLALSSPDSMMDRSADPEHV